MRLLLVESDASLCEALRAATTAAGSVLLCRPELPSQRWVMHEHFDAVLLDWRLDPAATTTWLRTLRLGGYVAPVLALLGEGQAEQMLPAIEAGASDCVLPPFVGAEALARVRLAAARRQTLPQRRVLLGDVQVDLDDRRAYRHHQPVALTANEWLLLEALVSRPGRTVTRGQLEALLDGRPAHQMSNRLEVHMANLRRKLGRDLFLTVRGLGYRTAG